METIASQEDELYMERVFELASKGLGNVAPNPMVGCVIVKDNKIIGEGYHRQFGEPHAEINAINSVSDPSKLIGAKLYVNLEPCSHQGKTPACAPVVSSLPLAEVIISNVDPNPTVNGKGMQQIKSAGITVKTGVLSKKGRHLNRRFFTFHSKKRPYIILKWAQTNDGFVARENFDSKWISNDRSRRLVHKWRTEELGIMVGHNTLKYDNPMLNARDWQGNNPTRIVIGKDFSKDKDLKLFDGIIPTLVFNEQESLNIKNLEYIKIESTHNLNAILKILYERDILSLIIEGGSSLLNSFISDGFWDEARVFVSKNTFERGIPAPQLNSNPSEIVNVGTDKLETYYNN